MTWEETIKFIRTQPEYKDLVELAYFEEDLPLNVERFRNSEEYSETKSRISKYIPLHSSLKILDIGSGNGISAIAFALEGFSVDAVEPDPSLTVGAGAINQLKKHYQLTNISIHEAFAEELKFPDNSFDLVYTRQCMHHANNLQQFLTECSRVIKKGGLLITVRDHVVFNETDKKWFLENHPLQKYYGGENAFSATDYKMAMSIAGFEIKQELKHFDSVINFFPLSKKDKEEQIKKFDTFVKSIVTKKLGIFSNVAFLRNFASTYVQGKLNHPFDEDQVPGRMYSYLALKN